MLIIKDFSFQETSTKDPTFLDFGNQKNRTIIKKEKKELPKEIIHLFNKKSPYYLLKSTIYLDDNLITVKNSLGNISLTSKSTAQKRGRTS